ncbi:MAG: SemiSWEET transporter [Proteobacteria bacterium]|nr:SemiSWEET transporter [Candidatus Enterousia scatequi]
MNTVFGEIFGYLSGGLTALAFLPQTMKTITTKNVSGLSRKMYIMYTTALVCWIIYGIYLHSKQIIFFNSITLTFNIIILRMIFKYGKKKHK